MICFYFQCEKLHSQKGRFLSAMRMAHTTSLDDTDQTIYSVRFVRELCALSVFVSHLYTTTMSVCIGDLRAMLVIFSDLYAVSICCFSVLYAFCYFFVFRT